METWEEAILPISSSSSPGVGAKSLKRTKSRVKNSSRRQFLDDTWSDDDSQQKHTEKESDKKIRSEDAPPSDNSWTQPLTLEDFNASDDEQEESFSFPAEQAAFRLASQNCSGMIIKLKRKEAEPSCVPFRPQRTGSSGRTPHPLGVPRKQNKKSLLKIKYCPYLSACHSAERRRRWVLRSAVRRASGVLGLAYPKLVGKRIRHLYEEDDKSEVWYGGEVLRVHEAHSDPLKTIFEVRYDSEPEWKYYLELLIDYKKGWLIIEEDT